MEMDSVQRAPPSGIQYTLPPMGLEAASNHREFFPEAGSASYGPSGSGKSNIIRIPLNVQGLVDARHSYLKFSITNNLGDGANLWPSASNFIRRLRILSGSNQEIERIDNYNNLHATLSDLLMPRDHRTTVANATEGFPAVQAFTSNLETGYTQFTDGQELGFSVALVSGFLNSKYIPCFAVAGSGIVIEIELENARVALRSPGTAAAGYTMSNVRFIADTIDMGPEFYQSFKEALKVRPIQWGATSYYGTTSVVAAGATSINSILGLKFRSINALVTTVRAVAALSNIEGYAMARLPLNNDNTASTYQYRIGSKLYPQASISVKSSDPSQAMQETQKAFAGVGNVQVCGSLNRTNFGKLLNDNYTSEQNGPVYAIDLNCYSQDTGVRESGLDTASNGLMIEFVAQTVGVPGTVLAGSKQIDCYAQYDAVYTLDGQGNLTSMA